VGEEIRALIFRMAAENPTWGAPRIHGELLKLGFNVSEPTVSRWLRMNGISGGLWPSTCATTVKTERISGWRRIRQQVGLRKFALSLEARFNPYRDSAGCTIVMRWQRR
jgi:hypothetical protein